MTEICPLLDTYGHYIDGKWVDPDSGRYDDVDPASEKVIATAPDASVAQVGSAIGAARRRVRLRCVVRGGPCGAGALPRAARRRSA